MNQIIKSSNCQINVHFILSSTLVGTTDTPWKLEDYPEATEEDIQTIINETAKYLCHPIEREDILAVWCGLRPLIRKNHDQLSTNTASISRSHEVWTQGDGLITVAGGKWTTVRNMAEDVCDVIGRRSPLKVYFHIYNNINNINNNR